MPVSRIRPSSDSPAAAVVPASFPSDRGAIDPLLTAREGAAILSISIATFWRRVADGTIPKPLKLGNASRWPQSELLAVIEAAKAQRGK